MTQKEVASARLRETDWGPDQALPEGPGKAPQRTRLLPGFCGRAVAEG